MLHTKNRSKDIGITCKQLLISESISAHNMKKWNMKYHIHNSDVSLHNVLTRIFSRRDDPGSNPGTLTFVVNKNSPFFFILGLKDKHIKKKGKWKSVFILSIELIYALPPSRKLKFYGWSVSAFSICSFS